MKHLGKFAALAAVLALSASSAFAAPIAAPIVGTIVYNSGVETVTGQSTFTAIAASAVFTDLANPFAGCNNDCLTFAITATDLSGNLLEHVTYGPFTGFLSQAGFTAGSGAVAPSSITLNANGGYDFSFVGSPIGNGETTDILYVQTNATSFVLGTLGVIDNSAGTAGAAIPATPEPSSLMLMGSGLVSAAGMFMRRRRVTA